MDAFAYACFANQTHKSMNLRDTARLYEMALRSTNRDLAHCRRALDDATVVAVWMFSVYEVSELTLWILHWTETRR